MARAHAQAERVIDASAAEVYSVLADYTTHHPRIMPSSFSKLEVEQGGVGEGTVFHITLSTLGKRQTLHMRVAEPEPGRVLTETDLDSGLVTEFAVEGNGSSTVARISSEWETSGLLGRVDGLVKPRLLRRIFTQQLAGLADYMDSKKASR